MGLTQKQLDGLLPIWMKGAQQNQEGSVERAVDSSQKRAAQDAALAQLIKGKQFDEEAGQRNITANTARVREEMRRSGIDPSRASMTFNESGGGFNPDIDPMGKAVKKALLGANITGYDVADPERVVPTAKDAEEVKKATASLKALQGTGTAVQRGFNEAGPLDRFGSVTIPFTNKKIGTEKGISLDSGITDMVIQLKELSNLGAITGPDMTLMESAMGNLTGVGSLIGDKDRAIKQLNDVLNRAKSKVETNATSRGYAPQAGYLDAPKQDKQPPSFEEWKAMKARGQ